MLHAAFRLLRRQPPPAAQRRALLAALPVLLSPAPAPDGIARLRRIAASAHVPLPWLPGLDSLELQLRDACAHLGIGFDALFRRGPQALPPGAPRAAAIEHFQRRAATRRAIAALQAAGVGPVLLVKGAVLADLHRAPALRRMGDADLVVPCHHLRAARVALARAGFAPGPPHSPESFVCRQNGAALDLHVPRPGIDLLSHAAPLPPTHPLHPAWAPSHPLHLLLVACHAARHAGGRVWRDTADTLALLHAAPDPAALVDTARALAAHIGGLGELEGLLLFLDGLPGATPPGGPLASPAPPPRARRLARLYRAMALEPVPPTALSFARQALLPRRPVPRPAPAPRRRSAGAPRQSEDARFREPDFGLGAPPPARTLRRQAFKLLLALALLASGRARPLLALSRLQRQAEHQAPWPLLPGA